MNEKLAAQSDETCVWQSSEQRVHVETYSIDGSTGRRVALTLNRSVYFLLSVARLLRSQTIYNASNLRVVPLSIHLSWEAWPCSTDLHLYKLSYYCKAEGHVPLTMAQKPGQTTCASLYHA